MVIWDYLVLSAIALVVLFTPFAFGAVDAWAVGIAEVICFSLTILWLAKSHLAARGRNGFSNFAQRDLCSLAVPAVLLLAFVLFQLVPLPPILLRQLSPQAYRLYEKSLPGWPKRIVYADPGFEKSLANRRASAGIAILPTVDEVRSGAAVPFAPKSAAPPALDAKVGRSGAGRAETAAPLPESSLWRSLSVAPTLTRAGLLKCLAYGSLFFVVVFYPVGAGARSDERKFRRALVLIVLAAGTAVAFVGLTEQAFWNGKILWFYVPRDWGSPMPGIHRASGPFVDPDHFANYLAMIMPLALIGAIFRAPLEPAPRFSGFQILCAVASLMIIAAILISLSRAGWVEIGLGILTLAWLLRHRHRQRPDDESAGRLPSSPATWWLVVTGVALLTVVALGLLLVGPGERQQANTRIAESISSGMGIQDRWAVWVDTSRMVRDYPLFGVGLGSWPTVFPHYRRPPWSMYFAGEAQNDYVEAAAEYGVLGFLLLGWLCWRVGYGLLQGSRSLHSRHWPLFAALMPAIVIIGFHELLDLPLQIPANAILFVLLLAIAFRISLADRPQPVRRTGTVAPAGIVASRIVPAVVAITAAVAIFAAARQRETVYPDDLPVPRSVREAVASILSHPSSPYPHMQLADLVFGSTGSWLPNELEAAIWLDPNNPAGRDRYVQALVSEGKEQEALSQISTSVYLSPNLGGHAYLSPRLMPWLSGKERGAVESGLRAAVAHGYEGSVDSLAQFYSVEGRELAAAGVYEDAAQGERNTTLQLHYWLAAGEAYANAGKRDKAHQLFTAAMELAPENPWPYRDLIALVYGPEKNFSSATRAIQSAMNNGIRPAPLYLSLAEAAGSVEDNKTAEVALRQAVSYEPSFSNLMRLGVFYLDRGEYERASEPIRRAADINPRSAEPYFYLARAEEGAYQYSAAKADYQRAIALAPDNPVFKSRSLDLLRKIAAGAQNRH
ncbi:MAG: O-antigen ligase family protein [Candidatus Binataceae bacterium]